MTEPLPDRPPANPTAATLRRWGRRHAYPLLGLLLFAVIFLTCWEHNTDTHERIYLIGSHRIADPSFLGADFTWTNLSPTTAVYDYALAPLWSWFGEYGITVIGRLASWILAAWSLAALARALRFPVWSVVGGLALWILWGQTLAGCGSPLEGFQVKSFSYPLIFFALAWVLRGKVVRAGLAAGLGTALHIVVGGWGCLALFLTLVIQRRLFTWRQVATFLLATVPCVLPLLIAVALFHEGHVSREESAKMDEIYVTFAAPHCCDPSYYMSPDRWRRAAGVFLVVPVLAFRWPRRRGRRVLGTFLGILIALFGLGIVGGWLQLYGLLKLFPGQLGKALPALFLFVMVLAYLSLGQPTRRFGRALWTLVLAVTVALAIDRNVPENLVKAPEEFWKELAPPGRRSDERFYDWVRDNTPPEAVFITPFLRDFWPWGERAQVASIRQSPLDQRLIEWKARMDALNRSRPYEQRGFDVNKEMEANEGQMSVEELIDMRDRYGATYYVMKGRRGDLADHLVFAADGYSIYEIGRLVPR